MDLLKTGIAVESPAPQIGENLRYALGAAPGTYVQGDLDARGVGVDLDLVDAAGHSRRRLLDRSLGKSTFRFVMPAAGLSLQVSRLDDGDGQFTLLLTHALQTGLASAPPENAGTPLLSPRIARLANEVAQGGGTDGFWREMKSAGTPLVEPADKGGNEFILTFLVRGARGNARLMGGPTSDHEWLRPLPASDVWYRSFVVPAGTRLGYRIAVDIPDVPGNARDKRTAILATVAADPLNRHAWPADAPDAFNQESIIELPGAPVQPGVVEGQKPTGTMQRLLHSSPILKNQREILLYTPPGFSPQNPDAVLMLVFDGRKFADLVQLPAILDNLISSGRLPQTAVAFIENAGMAARERELPGDPVFADAMADEILPLVRSQLHFHPPANRVLLAGASYGGLAAVRIALAHPEAFGNALSMSGSFWWAPEGTPRQAGNYTAHRIEASPAVPVRLFLTAGLFEKGREGFGILETNRRLREALAGRGYDVQYKEYAAAHGYLGWRGAVGDGLLALFGKPS